MTIGMNLRKALSGTTLALAMAAAVILVPVGAQADNGGMPAGKSVCNTASHNGTGGNLSVDALDPQTAIRNSTDLRAKSGGSYNAAMHSQALSLCSTPEPTPVTTPDPGYTSAGAVDIT
ncbi:MAG: hypothetical protein E6G10_13050 [Actinobacteria bacterium]|nr:MAG: hypothetical protein E6G10_13050 [Actinomycetota bacterium]